MSKSVTKSRISRFVGLAGVGLLCACLEFPAYAQDTQRPTVSGISAPSARRKLAFNQLGIVQEVRVKEGDRVSKDQVLLILDDFMDRKELERLQLEANSQARLEAAQADLDVKRKVAERKTAPDALGAYTASEIEEAQLDVIFREKQVKVAEEEQQQAKLRAEQQAHKVSRMQLRSPIDGIVEKLNVGEGEITDPQRSSQESPIVVVQNDPMWIEVRELQTWQVAMLKLGQKLRVRYPDEKEWQEATVTFIAPVATAESNTQFVRLEMPNPANRTTGLDLLVELPEGIPSSRTAGN
jgi:multidrug efflux pump subunit AcrA (membrane-fusion protein)